MALFEPSPVPLIEEETPWVLMARACGGCRPLLRVVRPETPRIIADRAARVERPDPATVVRHDDDESRL